MSARDLIEEAARRYPDVPDAIAQRAINNLEAAGYRILGPDEVAAIQWAREELLEIVDYGDNTAMRHMDALHAIRALVSGGKP